MVFEPLDINGDGVAESWEIDYDGDGLIEERLIDANSNGYVDIHTYDYNETATRKSPWWTPMGTAFPRQRTADT